jgi:hypothetical protein
MQMYSTFREERATKGTFASSKLLGRARHCLDWLEQPGELFKEPIVRVDRKVFVQTAKDLFCGL